MATSPNPLIDQLRAQAASLGFDACRFASAADAWHAGARLQAFVDAGRHGEMGWMETTRERRAHPTAMWAEARSAIVLGTSYGPATSQRARAFKRFLIRS